MRIIIFQGTSQYDVLRESSRRLSQGFQELGHEAFVFDMTFWNSEDYLRIVDEFKPDFTIGHNPVCYFYDQLLHYEKTEVPHLVRLGDSPYYHMFDRALKDPSHPLVYTLVSETSFITQLHSMGMNRYGRIKAMSAQKVNHYGVENFRPFPIVFFGSLESPEEIINGIQAQNTSKLADKILEFISILPEWMNQSGVFLHLPIDQFFSEFVQLDKLVPPEQQINLLRVVYPLIDKYYRNYTRAHVLKTFAEQGLPLYVFGSGYVQTLLAPYDHVKLFSPVSFRDCLEIYANSKFVLNISPMFFYAHERISSIDDERRDSLYIINAGSHR